MRVGAKFKFKTVLKIEKFFGLCPGIPAMTPHSCIIVTLCLCYLVCASCTTVEWGWMGGDYFPSEFGYYGQLGTPSLANSPGKRRGAAYCYDTFNQEFWMFGGWGSIKGAAIQDGTHLIIPNTYLC